MTHHQSTYSDSAQTRTAYQEGRSVMTWTREEIDWMHKEAPQTVWAFGKIPFERRHAKAETSARP